VSFPKQRYSLSLWTKTEDQPTVHLIEKIKLIIPSTQLLLESFHNLTRRPRPKLTAIPFTKNGVYCFVTTTASNIGCFENLGKHLSDSKSISTTNTVCLRHANHFRDTNSVLSWMGSLQLLKLVLCFKWHTMMLKPLGSQETFRNSGLMKSAEFYELHMQ